MMASDLTKLVNASGFPFQIGIQRTIEASVAKHGFEIEAWEHPWRFQEESGFIDLILGRGNVRLVCECKRTRDAHWTFLIENRAREVDRARVKWVHAGTRGIRDDWSDFSLARESFESPFCAVRGSGEGDRPLLERIAALVVSSVEGLATEEARLLAARPGNNSFRVYVPVILTTARLWMCRFDPAAVDLTEGTIADADFTEVPFVSFRKALSTMPGDAPVSGDESVSRQFRRLSNAQDRTVLIINANAVVDCFSPR